MTSAATDRFVDKAFSKLQQANSSPIFGYEDSPLQTLEESVKELVPFVSNITDYVATAKNECKRHSFLLTLDESAAILLYTMPKPFFSLLNESLRAENRDALKPWFPFLKLFMTALRKLPSTDKTIWRGVGGNVSMVFRDGDVHIWWSVNSCSTDLRVVKQYLDDMGTLFAIDPVHGKDISEFSYFPEEHEVILMPGTHVRVKTALDNSENRFAIIQLEEEVSRSELPDTSADLFKSIKQMYQRSCHIESLINPAISFPIDECYINLTIVETKQQREKENLLNSDQYNETILETFEEIYGAKSLIDVKNIFDTCKRSEKQILVFGRAGIGKSTFCRYIAYQWATNMFWLQYEIVILIPLRRLTISRYPTLASGQNYSLIDLIKKEVFFDKLSEAEENCLRHHLRLNTSKVLWILDGYDEVVQNVPSHLQYLVEQLLSTTHHIVTSRPYLNTLSYDVQMEITGFTDENIMGYIQQFFSQMKDDLGDMTDKVETLRNLLESNRSVRGVAHIPVNLELICSVWSGKNSMETEKLTITALYNTMIEWLCRRYLKAQNIHYQKLSERELYERCKTELTFLECLAFMAMDSNTIIIRPDLLKRALDEANVSTENNPDILNIGILKSFHQKGIGTQIEMEKDYYFVHLSFQEYFAARYLINILHESYDNATGFVRRQKYNQRYASVFTFASGLLSKSNTEARINMFWNNILAEPVDLVGIRHMRLVIPCIEETARQLNFTRRPDLLEWVAGCVKCSLYQDNELIRKSFSQLLQKAPLTVSNEKITNTFINILQKGDRSAKLELLSLISELKLTSSTAALVTEVTNALNDEDHEIRKRACEALESFGKKTSTNEVINKLINKLEDQNENVRWSAYCALESLGEETATARTMSTLLREIEDSDVNVRQRACVVFGNLVKRRVTTKAISTLVKAIGDQDINVRRSACDALSSLGKKIAIDDVICQLVNALKDQREDLKWRICVILAKIGEKAATNQAITQLIIALDDNDVNVRWHAYNTLMVLSKIITTDDLVTQLMNVTSSGTITDGYDRVESNYQLFRRISAFYNHKLVISSRSNIVRRRPITTHIPVTPLVSKNKTNTNIRKPVTTNEVISAVLSQLNSEIDHSRWMACVTLAIVGEKIATNHVINQLLITLRDDNINVRRSACDALGILCKNTLTSAVSAALVTALGDQNIDVRRSACNALGGFSVSTATNGVIFQLVAALQGHRACVRISACAVFEKLGEKAATNEVISHLIDVFNMSDYGSHHAAERALNGILTSSTRLSQLDPEIISRLCLCQQKSSCLNNVSVEELLKSFFITENIDLLIAIIHSAFHNGVAITVFGKSIMVNDKKEPLVLTIPSVKLRQQILSAFEEQLKRRHFPGQIRVDGNTRLKHVFKRLVRLVLRQRPVDSN
ncbi:unnamed protein product [Adineta ricciae]|uniref:NAD(P)(+)--arginine ADP-ribosyltransferase n=1 Tax=Adineta ricciae TaxID=249248 RepID=A0A815MA90_ADIRI|nr:unnamed protein product [Adineta ricciae]CAF1501073.1 unnamed protein product [Adineta ricciae]